MFCVTESKQLIFIVTLNLTTQSWSFSCQWQTNDHAKEHWFVVVPVKVVIEQTKFHVAYQFEKFWTRIFLNGTNNFFKLFGICFYFSSICEI